MSLWERADSVALIHVSQLLPWVDVMRDLGLPVAEYLSQVALPNNVLAQDDILIPERPLWLLVDRVYREERVETLGFNVWRQYGRQRMAPLFARLMGARNARDGLLMSCRMANRLSSGGAHWLVQRDDDVLLCRDATNATAVGRWPMEQYWLSYMLDVARALFGPAWRPTKLYLQERAGRAISYDNVFSNCAVYVAQPHTAVSIPKGDFELALNRRSVAVEGGPLRAPYPAVDFAGSLRQMLMAYLAEGGLDVQSAADVIGMSPRTLQRRLRQERLTYSELMDHVRFHSSISLFGNSSMSLLDIAYCLGYSDPSHFTRAFRRWTGVTPRRYRAVASLGAFAGSVRGG